MLNPANLEETVVDAVVNVDAHISMEVTGLASCNLCDFDTDSEEDLKDHYRKGVHSSSYQEEFTCAKCNFTFKEKAVLEKHAIRAHPDDHPEALNCPKCVFSCEDKSELEKHVHNMHEVEHQSFECCECNNKFENKTS